ncbi:hypothetical protein F4801DRAFT_575380 [Xylaria longipes]|nr:hypothetical protein F4801DRAFT_575380 [Xylaria longipes]RYC62041.1 hypothetical protein CHU98_g4160 [Xylaria longipes]
MQLFGSLVAVLAATIIALPTSNTPRQLGGLGALGGATAPVTMILSEVGKHVPSALGKLGGTLPGGDKASPKPSNSTKPATKPADAGPLGSLGGVLGGVVWWVLRIPLLSSL